MKYFIVVIYYPKSLLRTEVLVAAKDKIDAARACGKRTYNGKRPEKFMVWDVMAPEQFAEDQGSVLLTEDKTSQDAFSEIAHNVTEIRL